MYSFPHTSPWNGMELNKEKFAFTLHRKIFITMWMALLQQTDVSYVMNCFSF